MTTKEKILQTALELFNETNTQTATTNHIAKAMGMSPGNLHYHFKNREEIIRMLYKQMREKMTLSVDTLPKTISELNRHEKDLVKIYFEYRFFYKEILFLFSRDKELREIYVKDNIAHRSRIKKTIENFIENEEMEVLYDHTIEYIVDTIQMSFQFYGSYLQTIGKEMDANTGELTINYINNSLRPFMTKPQAHNEASAWFDDLYHKNRDNHENIPWARQAVNPLLETYLKGKNRDKGKALVIGCGLGDDAKALEVAGYDVLAIDVSQTALDLAKERFNDSTIKFQKQDIFDMPQKYQEYFDFVFEAFTIQSLPVEFRKKMIKAISQTVTPLGELLIIAHKREHQFDGPPWPLEKEELDLFKTYALTEMIFEEIHEKSPLSNTRFKALYKKSI